MIKRKLDNWTCFNENKIQKQLKNVTIVSFDIFDTLIKRDVVKPIDVFKVVEKISGYEGFAQKRVLAENIARNKTNKNEISLQDIYECLGVSEYDKEKLMEVEIDCEIKISAPNLDMISFFNRCKEFKQVILVSDMYLTRDVIEKILKKNQVMGYQKFYLSNEVDKTKLNGELFKFVLNDLQIKADKILHIGNSFRADYLAPKKFGIKSLKCATYKNRLQRKYSNVLNGNILNFELLNNFLNNHTPNTTDTYYKFGYEVFGPLLYGFIRWLYKEARDKGIEQIFFLSRDGYVMKQLYEELDLSIPSFYLEVSRRSLRVPTFNKKQLFNEIIQSLTVPNMSNLVQILDSFGLEPIEYEKEIKECGLSFEEPLKRDNLINNNKFKNLFEVIKEDIFANANKERENFIAYIKQFNFNKKSAIVDIGWGGSMQKYLEETLREIGINTDIIGYYVGLTLKSKENLLPQGFIAKGFAFDCLNRDDFELESSYIGLIETMFLEQRGSVKNYSQIGNKVIANRYDYEYLVDGKYLKEASFVSNIQKGALQFSNDFNGSLADEIINFDNRIMYGNMHEVGENPTSLNIKQFGKFEFFNCGDRVYLANPNNIIKYCLHPKCLKKDLYDSQWKIGFLKALFHIRLPYRRLFSVLRRIANK